MTSRASLLVAAVAAGVFAASAGLTNAAMPVGTLQATSNADLSLAQAQTSGNQAQTSGKKSKKSKRQQEIDRSVESGTVPRRYMKNVPKQYHDMIPFAKQ